MTREKERERERRGRERGRGREDTNTGIQACRVGTRRARFAGFSGDPRSRLAVLARELLRKLEARWWCCFFFSSSSSSPASPFVSVLPKARAFTLLDGNFKGPLARSRSLVHPQTPPLRPHVIPDLIDHLEPITSLSLPAAFLSQTRSSRASSPCAANNFDGRRYLGRRYPTRLLSRRAIRRIRIT